MSLQKSDGRPNLPQKTREEIKAEREAKKAAKIAAKAAKINNDKTDNVKNAASVANCEIPVRDAKTDVAMRKDNKVVETDNIKSKSVTASCEILEKNIEADIATNATGSQPNREALKKNTIQSLTIIQNGASEGKNEGKSKAELRAARRAKQEAQRAAKQQQLLGMDNVKSKESLKPCIETTSKCLVKKGVMKTKETKENAHEVNLFKHLYQERKPSFNTAMVNSTIHPAIIRLGVQYANKVIVGSNARCVALLAAIKQVVQDFEKPAQADFIRGLESNLKKSVEYLHHCRPLAVSMHNAMRHLKWQMTQFSSTLSDKKVNDFMLTFCPCYIIIFL